MSDYDEAVKRWAAKKLDASGYPYDEVTKVEFRHDNDEGYSSLTPGLGPYTTVTVSYKTKSKKGNETFKRMTLDYEDPAQLIREVVEA